MKKPLAWLGIYIRSNNPGTLKAAYNAAPHRKDARLWDSDEYDLKISQDPLAQGVSVLSMSLFFHSSTERANFRGSLNSINGFINTALTGSYIKYSKCWHHDLLDNGSPVKSDELENVEEIVE